jgi:hypothetical protein
MFHFLEHMFQIPPSSHSENRELNWPSENKGDRMKSLFAFVLVSALTPSMVFAYSCRANKLIEGTLCTSASNHATRVVIGEGTDDGLLSQRRHPFVLFIDDQKVDEGTCVGTLATASMLLGPARCASAETTIRISGDRNLGSQLAQVVYESNTIRMDCENTCVNPNDL